MKFVQLFIAASVIIIVACNKDKLTTIPQLKLKSISPSVVVSNNIISIEGRYSDQEGDLDSVLVIYKWFNGATEILPLDTLRYSITNLHVPVKTQEADITVQFQYNNSDPSNGYAKLSGVGKDTTAAFGLILKDLEGNRSEYKESEKIRIKKP